MKKKFGGYEKMLYFCTRNQTRDGVVAQLVEQRTENPCVTGSIPVNATRREAIKLPFFVNTYSYVRRKD